MLAGSRLKGHVKLLRCGQKGMVIKMKKNKILLTVIAVLLICCFVCGCDAGNENVDPQGAVSSDDTAESVPDTDPESDTEPESQTDESETSTPVSSNTPVVSKNEPAPQTKPAVAQPDITYISGIMIVNKTYALPSTYNPGIDPTAWAALNEMISAAAKDSILLSVVSGFRSYDTQNWLYNNYVKQDGKEKADTYSARPGHSEHQTGLAFDLNMDNDSFAATKEGKWVAENCWKYGFIIRYPKGKEEQTGYKYEPWHVRYIGKDLSKSVFESGLCLEEYFGITSVYQD